MKPKWFIPLALAMAAVGAAIVFRFDPVTSGFFPRCPLHWLTGLHCPGCGSLRATHQLLHGNFAAACRYNVLWVALIPVLAVLCLPRFRMMKAWVPWTLFGVIVVFGVLRNLPWLPLTLLAPH